MFEAKLHTKKIKKTPIKTKKNLADLSSKRSLRQLTLAIEKLTLLSSDEKLAKVV